MEQDQPSAPPPPEETIFPAEEFSMDGYDKHVRNARIVLFVVAALQLLAIYMLPALIDDTTRTIAISIYATIAAIFVCVAFWSWKKPFVAILSGLILYGLLVILDLVANPMAAVIGIFGYIVKGIIIVLLILGLKNAREIQEARKTFGQRAS